MDSNDFEVGDVVRLNCSAFRMTVDKIEPGAPEGEIVCIWINDAADLCEARFHPKQLVLLPRRG